jgi:5-methylcytosine-specific restriction endonuclease McrA
VEICEYVEGASQSVVVYGGSGVPIYSHPSLAGSLRMSRSPDGKELPAMKTISKKDKKKLRRFDKEDSWAGPATGRWLWDASRRLRDKNLREFWMKWDKFTVVTSPIERYELLKSMTVQVYCIHSLGKLHTARMRRRFNIFKEEDFRLEGKLCGWCEGPAKIRHHVIPIKNGGHNHALNLLPLCRACHAEIHEWLAV